MRNRTLIHLAAAMVITAAAACGGDDDGAAAPETADAGSTHVATSPRPASEVLDDRLPEGVYHTAELTRDQLIAAGVAGGFTEDEVTANIDTDPGAGTTVFGVRLAAGTWNALIAVGDGPEEVGWRGTYEVVDDHTVIATDSCGSITYHYTRDGDQLTLELVDDECDNGPGELIAQTVIYESAPFTRDAKAPTSPASTSTYASTSFVVPFDVTLPEWLPAVPSAEQPNFVTWESGDADRAIRFLVPVDVYPPGGTGTAPPPDDYRTYLLGQSAEGAELRDTVETTVGGHAATILTATVPHSLDGSLGCPKEGMSADECFGLQPDLALRIAVIDVGDRTLLVWERDTIGSAVDYDSFNALLASLRLDESRAPTTAVVTVPTTSPIDGTSTASFTRAELTSWASARRRW